MKKGLFKGVKMRILMPEVGLEPTLPKGNGILNPARLPIPPLRLRTRYYSELACLGQIFFWIFGWFRSNDIQGVSDADCKYIFRDSDSVLLIQPEQPNPFPLYFDGMFVQCFFRMQCSRDCSWVGDPFEKTQILSVFDFCYARVDGRQYG